MYTSMIGVPNKVVNSGGLDTIMSVSDNPNSIWLMIILWWCLSPDGWVKGGADKWCSSRL